MDLHKKLAARLPDIPRWVETRSALLGGGSRTGCELFGGSSEEMDFVVRSDGTLFVVGRPSHALIEQALRDPKGGEIDDVLAPMDVGDWVARALPARFVRTTAILHTLPDLRSIEPFVRDLGRVRVMNPDVLFDTLPVDLADEIRFKHPDVPLAVAFDEVEATPVAFSYAGSMTETLWDVSIDTLEGYRRRGYAVRCAAFLIDRVNTELHRMPIWGAVAENEASLSLAKKLGFEMVDEIAYWES